MQPFRTLSGGCWYRATCETYAAAKGDEISSTKLPARVGQAIVLSEERKLVLSCTEFPNLVGLPYFCNMGPISNDVSFPLLRGGKEHPYFLYEQCNIAQIESEFTLFSPQGALRRIDLYFCGTPLYLKYEVVYHLSRPQDDSSFALREGNNKYASLSWNAETKSYLHTGVEIPQICFSQEASLLITEWLIDLCNKTK